MTEPHDNMPRFDRLYDRVGWRALGVPSCFGPTRSARLTLLADRTAARTYLRPILDWDFRRILVTHGDAVEHDAAGEFRRAFARYLG